MNCEEFEQIGLGPALNEAEAAAAAAHARSCAHCAALEASWLDAKSQLASFAAATVDAAAPPRVEMRLRQELRTRRQQLVKRRVLAAAALAAAAVLAIMLVRQGTVERRTPKETAPVVAQQSAESNADDFLALPGRMAFENEDASVVRVRMQRGGLSALGLPVNPERANEWIQVELLVGEDGQPEAVRLAE